MDIKFNPTDSITVDVPLFIRLLEYAREDAKTDMDLHNVAEKAIEINKSKKTLSMQDYEDIVPAMESMDEGIHDKDITSASHTNIKTPPKGVGDYDPKERAASLARLANMGPKNTKPAKEEISDLDSMRKYVAKYAKPEDVEKEISKYKSAGFQAFSEPVKIGLRSDMDFITWVQMKHDEQQLRREKGLEYITAKKEASKKKTERLNKLKETSDPQSGKSAPYGSGYAPFKKIKK